MLVGLPLYIHNPTVAPTTSNTNPSFRIRNNVFGRNTPQASLVYSLYMWAGWGPKRFGGVAELSAIVIVEVFVPADNTGLIDGLAKLKVTSIGATGRTGNGG